MLLGKNCLVVKQSPETIEKNFDIKNLFLFPDMRTVTAHLSGPVHLSGRDFENLILVHLSGRST